MPKKAKNTWSNHTEVPRIKQWRQYTFERYIISSALENLLVFENLLRTTPEECDAT